jgi:hypothetical protein
VKPICSLSLDLDNEWSYLKTHGDSRWESYPSYFDTIVPRALDVLSRNDLRITFFIVGQDAVLAKNRDALAQLGRSHHEIGSHSFRHEPWFHLYSPAEIDDELARTEDAVGTSTGRTLKGFRGPGFSVSENTLRALLKRGYRYDASTLPTFIGPLARAYYFMTAKLEAEERDKRARLFGDVRDALRPLRPYCWRLGGERLLEIPVTTFPLVRVPIHASYVLYLSVFSQALAWAYFDSALATCRALGVEPSILLHPLDFLGQEDVSEGLRFFPAMQLSGAEKVARITRYLEKLTRAFDVLPMCEHAGAIEARAEVREIVPRFRSVETSG